jgi:hypothetical protein
VNRAEPILVQQTCTNRVSERNAFHGHCIVIIQAGAKPEKLQLTAASPGLQGASVTFRVPTP